MELTSTSHAMYGGGLTYGTLISLCSSLIPLTKTGATPLYIASQNGHHDTVNTLIQNGADINWPCNVERGLTYGTLNLCSLLIPLTQDGTPPLYIASQNGHSDTVTTLIRNGANVNQPNKVYTIYHSPLLLVGNS